MNDFETRLANRMHNLTAGETGGPPPTQKVLARGRRARHRRRAIVSGCAAALVVAVGAVATTVEWSAPNQSQNQAEAETPAIRLAAAVAASDNTSYRVKVTWDTGAEVAGLTVTEGAFDPAKRTGFLTSKTDGGGTAYLERLVDGVRYTGCEACDDQWKQYPGTHDRLAYDQALGGAVSASADPQVLFDALTQAGAVITQTDKGFHFEVTSKDEFATTLTGDVAVGADNRIAKVSYEETTRTPETKGATDGPGTSSTWSVTVELSDYGTPVSVERPTDVVVVQK